MYGTNTHLHLLKILVLFDIKSFHIEKAVQARLGKALQTIEDGQIVRALTRGGVVKIR